MSIKYANFEDYLQDMHGKENPEVRDDDTPDDYERWLEDIGIEGVIRYADIYAKKYALNAVDIASKQIISAFKK